MLTGNLEKIAEHGKRADNIVKSHAGAFARGQRRAPRRRSQSAGRGERSTSPITAPAPRTRASTSPWSVTSITISNRSSWPTGHDPRFLNLFGNGFYAANKRAQRMATAGFRPVLHVATREGRRGRGARARQWHGHPARHPRQAVPAVLHHQADRRGDRAGPVDQLRHRDATAWRHDRRRQRVGEFTEFTVRLPRHNKSKREEPSHERQHPGGRRRARCRGLFRQRFRREARQGTYVLHFAASGEEALDQLADEIEPQLIVILSDINMPGMDGLELLREVKQRRPDLPVMMVTAYGDDERRRRAARIGAFEFVTKPVDFDHLLKRSCGSFPALSRSSSLMPPVKILGVDDEPISRR
jgi:CheY-like chemotaxis protein